MFEEKTADHKFIIKTLDQQVLVVASINLLVGDWSAYIGAVIGINPHTEWKLVHKFGSKLDYKIAKVIFDIIAKKYRWRK